MSLSPLPDPNEADKASQRATVKRIVDTTDWHNLSELHMYQAKVMRSKYQAALRQGFTTDQALDVCHKEWK